MAARLAAERWCAVLKSNSPRSLDLLRGLGPGTQSFARLFCAKDGCSYFSIGRPKNSTYPLSMTSNALSPSWVLASSRCMGTCLAANSAYRALGFFPPCFIRTELPNPPFRN